MSMVATVSGVGRATSVDNKMSVILDGNNDYVKAPHNTILNFGSGSFTISAWFKASSSGLNIVQCIVSKIWDATSGTGNPGWALSLNASGRVQVHLGDITNLNNTDNVEYAMSQVDYRDDVWHHIAIVIDRTLNVIRFYLDSELNSD